MVDKFRPATAFPSLCEDLQAFVALPSLEIASPRLRIIDFKLFPEILVDDEWREHSDTTEFVEIRVLVVMHDE